MKKKEEGMDVVEVAAQILKKTNELDNIRRAIKERAVAKATAMANYRKALAVTTIKLLNNIELGIDEDKIKNVKATNVGVIAHGICHKEKLDQEQSIALYDSAKTNLDVIKTQISALQTIYKHLQEA